jgi:phage antirepressor YoqD-like protein
MVTVPFHGANLEAAEADGKVWVSVRRMCEPLEIGFNGQHDKLSDVSRAPWACTRVMRVHDTTGREQDAFCLDLDSVPMWLATIDSSRVAPHLREKIVLFQREAAKALRDHFFGLAPVAPRSYLDACKALVVSLEREQALALEVAVLTPKAEFHDRVAECTNAVDMSDVCKVLGIGLKKFYRRLRGDEIIELRSTRPLQVHMDAGRFTLVTGTHETNSRGPQMHSTTKVTAKGFLYLVKKYGKPGKTYQLPSIGVETTKPLPPAPAPTLFDGMAAE